MAKQIVQVDHNTNKYYEMDKIDAIDMLDVCRYKAACLSYCAPKLFSDGIDGDSPVAEGLGFLLADLADEIEIASKVLHSKDKEETTTLQPTL
jgi:hypothetical protein